MIKEEKNIDFYTTGRQPSEEDFNRISEWIRNNKLKKSSKAIKDKALTKNKDIVVSKS